MSDRDKQAEYKFYYREALAAILKYAIKDEGMHRICEELSCGKTTDFYVPTLKTMDDLISIIRNLLKDKECLDDGVKHSLFDDLVDFSGFTNDEKNDLYNDGNLHYINGSFQESKQNE